MSKMSQTIQAKSDQLNSDDLISGPITITITAVNINVNTEQQPVSISFTGDNNKPWKPSKSMRRVLVLKWGDDEDKYIGRHLTLFRDPTIKFGGEAVGGIIISHMSNMDNADRFLLTSSRGAKKPLKVEHLLIKTPEQMAEDKLNRAKTWVSQSKLEISELDSAEAIKEWEDKNVAAIKSLSKYEEIHSEFIGFIGFIKISISGTKSEDVEISDEADSAFDEKK